MKIGAWIHNYGGSKSETEGQFEAAAAAGLQSVRGYSVDYSEQVAAWVTRNNLTLIAGLHVDSEALVEDWRTQVDLDGLDRSLALQCSIEAICVGNELREGGDGWESKRFTARLSYGLCRLIETYQNHCANNGHSNRFTYAMEGIVFDESGAFRDHLWPLIDLLDVVSINHYPMTVAHWRDFTAFDVSASFLRESRSWQLQMCAYELHLRQMLEALEKSGKPLFLSEMGFPSGVSHRVDGEIDGRPHIWPVSDNEAFQTRMNEYVTRLASVSNDYDGRLEAIYFYEWWDNHYHSKIWNIEQSPIHTCFGLCDAEGNPKIDIPAMVSRAQSGGSSG